MNDSFFYPKQQCFSFLKKKNLKHLSIKKTIETGQLDNLQVKPPNQQPKSWAGS
jgi:hypothetical protein